MKFLHPPDRPAKLGDADGGAEAWHVFTEAQVDAVNAALAAGRPLLVRGEPGTGKSQLARAAAAGLGRVLLVKTIDARTEARDLLWSFDAVARLAEAQVQGVLQRSEIALRDALDPLRFIEPGPIWWAFDWVGARAQAERARAAVPPAPPAWQPGDGAVLLIDEIDKADSAVPNGLLEAFGQRRFAGPVGKEVVCAEPAPLVLITTNEERALPDAFLRRCLVLQLTWPADAEEMKGKLMAWGRAHFVDARSTLLAGAADLLIGDRRAALERGLNPPGGAEYLDLLRAVIGLAPGDPEEQERLLGRVAQFALAKHPAEPGD
jgi:MoxR-like ATPase